MKAAILSAACIAALSPTIASAVDFNAAATLGYARTETSGGGGTADTVTLDATGDVAFGNGIELGFDLTALDLDSDVAGGDAQVNFIGVELGYAFQSGVKIGLYAEQSDLEDSGVVSGKLQSYGLMVGYEAERYTVGAFYGESETDPSLPAGTSIEDFGLTFSAELTPEFTVAANLIRTRVSAGGADADIDLIDLGAAYQVNDRFAVFGGFSKATLDTINTDIRTFGIGASYAFNTSSSFPVIASVELARSTIDTGAASTDADTIRVGVTIPFGKSGSATPLNSVAANAMRSQHSALSSTILAAY